MITLLTVLARVPLLGAVVRWIGRRTLTAGHVMGAYAKDAVDHARSNFGVTLDFSEGSVRVLEELVGRQHDEYAKGNTPDEEGLETFCKMWGAYLGEVIRKQHGGEWTVASEGPFAGAYLLTIGDTQMSPPSKIYKRIVDGPEDNLEHYYQVMIQMKDGKLERLDLGSSDS